MKSRHIFGPACWPAKPDLTDTYDFGNWRICNDSNQKSFFSFSLAQVLDQSSDSHIPICDSQIEGFQSDKKKSLNYLCRLSMRLHLRLSYLAEQYTLGRRVLAGRQAIPIEPG